MIVIDTHIWLWWVLDPKPLTRRQMEALLAHEQDVIGVSVISCWEIAKLVQLGRIELKRSLKTWLEMALGYPGIQVLPLTPEIAMLATQLPDGFRSDPADEIIVATALHYSCSLVTSDGKMREYAHVRTI
ncbi:MAG: type II toxin-antitoxin system VapC family toxin [Caldilineales bacterium]|nr:type II toxin-antitoxin system VapC family toxin [Caldilineales bacterium]MCW5857789.1 type II toxin-antitoxin system VapC family toxin [Caldilineales bacterium]